MAALPPGGSRPAGLNPHVLFRKSVVSVGESLGQNGVQHLLLSIRKLFFDYLIGALHPKLSVCGKYRFSFYHLVAVDDLNETSHIEYEQIGGSNNG